LATSLHCGVATDRDGPESPPAGCQRDLVKKRIGDRRKGPRFEIVGALSGTLETWQRLKLLNVGAGGALLEAPAPLLSGSRVSGRVTTGGQLRELRALVRRVEPDTAQQRYRVAVEWGQPLAETDALLAIDPSAPRRESMRIADRRKSARIAPRRPSEIEWPTWSTVALLDISTTGLLFTSPVALAVGEKGHIRMRLGDRAFTADVEIRRGQSQGTRHPGYRVGATFSFLDEVSRFALDDFLGDQRA
jgi:hypothetical protein